MSTVNNGLDDAFLTLEPVVRHGLNAMLVCSATSFLATTTLLSFLAYRAFRAHRMSRHELSMANPMRGTYSIHTQGYFWLVNLFIADWIQSIGLVLVADHLRTNSVLPGSLCTAQGFLINTGDVASAVWSFIIAAHTFILLAGGRRWRSWVAEKSTTGKARWLLVFGLWGAVFLLGIFGITLVEKLHPERGPFFNNAGAGWCWIDEHYYWERIFFHYIFLFIDMFALTVLYCILFFYIRLQLKNFRKANSTSDAQSSHELSGWQANLEAGRPEASTGPKSIMTTKTVTVTTEDRPMPRNLRHSEAERTHRRMNQVALTLLCYPIMYICLTLTLCITRLAQFANVSWGLTPVYVGASIFSCTGWVNVLMYTVTRKGIISWSSLFQCGSRARSQAGSGTDRDVKSPPPYHPHYPGATTKAPGVSKSTPTVTSKASATSLRSFQPPKTPSDSESHLEFPVPEIHHTSFSTDDTKLVHERSCPRNGVDSICAVSDDGTYVECVCKSGTNKP